MNTAAKKSTSNHFAPPPFPSLASDPEGRELWCDIVLAAISGLGGSSWSNDGKKISMPSAQVLNKAACEVADGVLAEFKKRCTK